MDAANVDDAVDREERYRVIFWGQAARGYQRDELVRAFAQRFQIRDRRRLAKLFSGRPVALKQNLSIAEAHRYITIVQDMGGICKLQIDDQSPASFSSVPKEPEYLSSD